MAVTSFPPPSTPTPPVATLAPAPAMASVPAPAMLTAPTLPAYNIPECIMYKSLLHEHIQKASLPMAIYKSFNEGSAHWPRFRSTVLIGEEQFISSNVFLHRKEAEQDAAKTALECLRKRIKEEGFPIIHEGTILCKSILNEYAVKRQLERPVYSTIQPQGSLPVFISSVVFNGVTCTGENARTKKEAEQLAARALVLALINDGDSTSSAIISEIIKSKRKSYALLPKNKDFQNAESSTLPVGNDNVQLTAVSQAAPEVHPPQQAVSQAAPEVHPPQQAVSQAAPEVHPPQQAFAAVPTAAAVQEGIKPVAEAVQGLKPVEQFPNIPQHVFVVPKVEAIKEGIELPIAFVPPMVDPTPDDGPSTGKRKRKNRRKNKKKMRTES
ncbi:double-stranded RNA-binding protein 4-like isoform X2 [Euphorbia lathyris]